MTAMVRLRKLSKTVRRPPSIVWPWLDDATLISRGMLRSDGVEVWNNYLRKMTLTHIRLYAPLKHSPTIIDTKCIHP